MQRVKGSKGQNVIEFHSRLGHLKNISHPSLFPEEGPSCYPYDSLTQTQNNCEALPRCGVCHRVKMINVVGGR